MRRPLRGARARARRRADPLEPSESLTGSIIVPEIVSRGVGFSMQLRSELLRRLAQIGLAGLKIDVPENLDATVAGDFDVMIGTVTHRCAIRPRRSHLRPWHRRVAYVLDLAPRAARPSATTGDRA